MVQYLVKSPRHLVQYVACNLLPKGYTLYSVSYLPDGKDPLLVDAKLLLAYGCHYPKEKQYRRRKAGHASVKYLRCGRLILIMSTKGKSPFFEREGWCRVQDRPLHIAGYALTLNDAGKVSVRVHREAQRKLKRQFTERAGCDLAWWENTIRNFPFLPFAGVRDNVFALLRHVNECRRLLRKPPVDWRNCVRKEFTPEPVFLETPPEIEELLHYELAQK